MAHHYGLDFWRWNDEEGAHEPPLGARAVLDFRPEEKQAEARQNVEGYGFFDWPDTIDGVPNEHSRPDSAIPLGDGDCREYKPTTAERNELKTRLGITGELSGETLVANIRSVLGENADPTGQSGPKPLMPDRFGNEEIHLSNHSKVWAAKFDWREVFAATPRGAANRMRDVIRLDLERTHADGGSELLAKVVGSWCDRAAVRYDDGPAWRGLMRAALRQKAGGSFKPKRPTTSYTDDFSGTLAAWSSVAGTWLITGGALVCGTSGVQTIRYQSDLSSSDHWATLTQLSGGSTSTRPYAAVRFASAANTCYTGNGTSGGFTLGKIVTGTYTALSTTVSGTAIDTCETRAVGSTISITRVAGGDASLTDTAITGNTRCGVGEGAAAGTATPVNAWSCDDGLSGVVGPVLFFMHYLSQGWR